MVSVFFAKNTTYIANFTKVFLIFLNSGFKPI